MIYEILTFGGFEDHVQFTREVPLPDPFAPKNFPQMALADPSNSVGWLCHAEYGPAFEANRRLRRG